jgi:pimeloyl-ACP methyl ester carboxylesterase
MRPLRVAGPAEQSARDRQGVTVPPAARLIDVAVPVDPAGIVLVLHGGASRRRTTRVSPAQLSVLRMIPVASRIVRVSRRRLAVLRLLNSSRGWDTEHTPLEDVDWALGEIAQRFGSELPVGLVGHSLGGRAALLAADRPTVGGVVALAPWVYRTDVVADARGAPVVIIHGDADRIASPERSRQVGQALSSETRVAYGSVPGGTHSMLGRLDTFDGLAAQCAVWMLLGQAEGTVVKRIAAGETWLEV